MVQPPAQPDAQPSPSGLGLRERKSQRTRQSILDAAWLLFTRDGVANTPIAAIAEVAEVSEVTLYNYFRSRRHLIEQVMLRQVSMTRVLQAMRERPASEGPVEVLRAIHQGQAELSASEFKRQVKILRIINQDAVLRGTYQQKLRGYVEQTIDTLMPRAEAIGMSRRRLETLCFALSGIVDALSEDDSALASAQTWADATDEALVMLAEGWGGANR